MPWPPQSNFQTPLNVKQLGGQKKGADKGGGFGRWTGKEGRKEREEKAKKERRNSDRGAGRERYVREWGINEEIERERKNALDILGEANWNMIPKPNEQSGSGRGMSAIIEDRKIAARNWRDTQAD